MRRLTSAVVLVALFALAAGCSDDKKNGSASASSQPSSRAEDTSVTTAPKPVPAGFIAIPAPAGVDPTRFGQNVAIASLNDGRPVVAFSFQNENDATSKVEV